MYLLSSERLSVRPSADCHCSALCKSSACNCKSERSNVSNDRLQASRMHDATTRRKSDYDMVVGGESWPLSKLSYISNGKNMPHVQN